MAGCCAFAAILTRKARLMSKRTPVLSGFSITLPVPDYSLSKNGRLNPWERNTLYQGHKRIATAEINRQLNSGHDTYHGPVILEVRWYAAKPPYPDSDNATERLAAYRDAAESTGLIGNDVQIEETHITFRVDAERPRVELVFERAE